MTDNSIILLRGWYKGVHMNFPFRPCIYSDRNWLDFIQSFKCDWRSEVLETCAIHTVAYIVLRKSYIFF